MFVKAYSSERIHKSVKKFLGRVMSFLNIVSSSKSANPGKNWLSKRSSFPSLYIRDALHDLVPFLQFKTIEKHPWRSLT